MHGSGLLARAVAELDTTGGDALTVIGRQTMASFWEQLVQPQVFLLLALRYPRMGVALPARRWRSAIANGQYLLFRQDAYQEIGGHAAVRYEAAEDLRLAQRLVAGGCRLIVRSAHRDLATRMYQGLGEVVAGWSKNMMQAGLRTVPQMLRPCAAPLMLLSGMVIWLAPPAAFGAALLGMGETVLLAWSAGVTGCLMLFWTWWGTRFGAPAWVGPLYPLDARGGTLDPAAQLVGTEPGGVEGPELRVGCVCGRERGIRCAGSHAGAVAMTPPVELSAGALSRYVDSEARALGFTLVGIAPPDPSQYLGF